MSERTSSAITLPWATQEDVDDFFTPPTKPVKPLFVAAYLLAQLFFFIALLGPAIVAIQVKVMAMFPSDNSAQVDAVATIAGLGALGALFANVIFGQISDLAPPGRGDDGAPGSSSASSLWRWAWP